MSASGVRFLLTALSPAGRRARLSILIFHRVLPAPDSLQPSEIDERTFSEILTWLGECFTVIPLADAVARLRAGGLPARAAAITFDDGYADNYTSALPVLQAHGMHATFFIATAFLDGGRMWNDSIIEAVRRTKSAELDLRPLGLGSLPMATLDDRREAIKRIIPALKHLRPQARNEAVELLAARCGATLPRDLMLSSEQLRALHSAGMGIGAHTVNHPILAVCDDTTARREIAQSRERLEALIGGPVSLFAYPNGKLGADYTDDHVRMVRELGFDAAVTTNPGASSSAEDVYQLRRFTPWDRRQWPFTLRMAHNLLSSRRPAA